MTSPYDVCIVGAGPAGATTAFYLARHGLRVLLLEKERFPRDKLCGDAICGSAHTHLRRMGVLQEIERLGLGRWAEVGGLVSPGGYRYIGNSAARWGRPLVIAIKRQLLDEKIARAAAAAGAELVEGYQVRRVERAGDGWTIHGSGSPFRARVLVLADGSSSGLARKQGLVRTAPEAVCSRVYVRDADFDADGVVYYPPELLPGYCALFREAGGDLNLGCYILPGGRPTSSDLRRLYQRLLDRYEPIRQALGPRAKLDRMRGAPIRLGGVPTTCGEHLLIVGDAAGQVDPLTGEGIQYAMDAAELAARTLAEAFAAGDWSGRFLRRYQERCQSAFAWDFGLSRRMAVACGRFPMFLDACAETARRRGGHFLVEWAAAMTGTRPKSDLLRPAICFPLLVEAFRLAVMQSDRFQRARTRQAMMPTLAAR